MANLLKVAVVHTILTLRQQGWSFRRIATEVGIHRETVARYVRLAQSQNRPEVIIGSDGSKPANAPIGRRAEDNSIGPAEPGCGPDGGPAFIALRPTAEPVITGRSELIIGGRF